MPFSAAHGDYTRNEEPSLDEILNEPIIRLLMARDGVEVKTLRLPQPRPADGPQ
jgi:hypothetical protein